MREAVRLALERDGHDVLRVYVSAVKPVLYHRERVRYHRRLKRMLHHVFLAYVSHQAPALYMLHLSHETEKMKHRFSPHTLTFILKRNKNLGFNNLN